jgi:ribosomal protein S11
MKMEKPAAMLAVHRAGQQLETAVRTAAESGLTVKDVADALNLPLNAVRAIAARWKLDQLW